MTLARKLAVLAACTVAAPALAQQAGTAQAPVAIGPPAPLVTAPDPALTQRGQALATQGAGSVPPCSSCHGMHGEGNAQAGYPRLAAQSVGYLARQLDLYASGQRQNPIMGPIASQMDAAQRAAAASYYATLDASGATNAAANAASKGAAKSTPSRIAPASTVQRLVLVGDQSRDIQGCANCHGPGGIGEPPLLPALAGQVEPYLAASLTQWKSGARNTDPSGQMHEVASRLTDAEIAGLAQYFAAQPPPRPAPYGAAPDMATGATSGGPTTATPTQGIGVGQGAATSGGEQGPGGGGAASGTGPSGSPGGTSGTPTTPPR